MGSNAQPRNRSRIEGSASPEASVVMVLEIIQRADLAGRMAGYRDWQLIKPGCHLHLTHPYSPNATALDIDLDADAAQHQLFSTSS